MHDARKGPALMFLGKDRGHIFIGSAGMDDQRQSRLARGLDMDAQALLLGGRTVRRVMIIQPAFANAHKLRMLRQGDQLIHLRHRLIGHGHRMGACGVKNRLVCLGNGAHSRLIAQPRADRDHPAHTGLGCARNHIRQLIRKIREIQMTMAVSDLRRHGPAPIWPNRWPCHSSSGSYQG